MKYTILIVEDDPALIELLRLYLETEFTVLSTGNGHEAMEVVARQHVDLAIADIMMPGMDGLQWVRTVRERHRFPILILSARDQDHDKILGLGLGADDYLTKPFNPLEVTARVQAMLRRAYRFGSPDDRTDMEEEPIQAGELTLDPKSCTLYRDGEAVTLTSTEYKIIAFLMRYPNRVLTRKRIYESVWDDAFAYDDNTIMVHISNLREKIERDPKTPAYIRTIRGLGYKFEAPEMD
ncbi:response regulator transcription factor [Cohnella terricola]|uniref:Response regulator transcription factor n=1 Tax=Cohnella terricola TaxID=1289167 RepID=A0A559JWN2_9BACL|nr:response regulator transcription factor [Cohnella terricola]TVY04294.1 response regulator transcription factor [Cohnella terricola]